MARQNLTLERLKQELSYDPNTGLFSRIKPSKRPVGWKNGNGYIRIEFLGNRVYAHRLAWFYMTGAWPKFQIDHIDRNKSNNKFWNLRDVPEEINGRNCPPQPNRTGFPGVNKARNGKFCAQITIEGHSKHIGTFNTAEEAHAAFVKQTKALYGIVSEDQPIRARV